MSLSRSVDCTSKSTRSTRTNLTAAAFCPLDILLMQCCICSGLGLGHAYLIHKMCMQLLSSQTKPFHPYICQLAGGVAKYTPGQATEGGGSSTGRAAREALKFVLSKEGAFFREFLMNEIVVSIDGMSRKQLAMLVERLGLQVGQEGLNLSRVCHHNE